MKKKLLLLVSFSLGSLLMYSQNGLYWGDQASSSLSKSNLDGTNAQTIVTGQNLIRRVSVNKSEGKVYWVAPSSGTIKKSNLNGSNVVDVISVSSNIAVVHVDQINNVVYYSETGVNNIRKCGLDGSNSSIVVSATGTVQGIVVDNINSKIYWTEFNTGLIKKANLDGTGVTSVLTSADQLFDIDLNIAEGELYFTNRTGNKIEKISVDGNNRQTILNLGETAHSIRLDTVSNKIYFSTPDNIKTCDFNGNNELTLLDISGASISGFDFISSSTAHLSEENMKSSQFLLYPNPTSNDLTFSNQSDYNAVLSIYSLEGKLLKDNIISFSSSLGRISTIDLQAGSYLLKVKYDDDKVDSKIFIKK